MPAAQPVLLLSSSPGQVTALPGVGIPLYLTIGRPEDLSQWGGFAQMQAIVTRVGLRESVNAQFLQTLRDRIYVYVFGDALGDLRISGIAMSAACGENALGLQPVAKGGTGLDRVYQWYRSQRLSATGAPVAIALATRIRVLAFLLSVEIDAQDPATGLVAFTLILRYPPQEQTTSTKSSFIGNGGGGGGGPGDNDGDEETDDADNDGDGNSTLTKNNNDVSWLWGDSWGSGENEDQFDFSGGNLLRVYTPGLQLQQAASGGASSSSSTLAPFSSSSLRGLTAVPASLPQPEFLPLGAAALGSPPATASLSLRTPGFVGEVPA